MPVPSTRFGSSTKSTLRTLMTTNNGNIDGLTQISIVLQLGWSKLKMCGRTSWKSVQIQFLPCDNLDYPVIFKEREQGPPKGDANSCWKWAHQSFIINKLYITGLRSGHECIILASQELSILNSSYWRYRRAGEIIHVFSAFLSYLMRRRINSRSTYTASNETAGMTRDRR